MPTHTPHRSKTIDFDNYAASALRATKSSVDQTKIDAFLYDLINPNSSPLDYMEVVFAQIDTVFFSAVVPYLLLKHGKTERNARIVGYFFHGEALHRFVEPSNAFAADLADHYRCLYILVFHLHRRRRKSQGWSSQMIADVGAPNDGMGGVLVSQLGVVWKTMLFSGTDDYTLLGARDYWRGRQMQMLMRMAWGLYEEGLSEYLWSNATMIVVVAAVFAVSYYASLVQREESYNKTMIGQIMNKVETETNNDLAGASLVRMARLNRAYTIFQLPTRFMTRNFALALPINVLSYVSSNETRDKLNAEKAIEKRACVVVSEPVVEMLFQRCRVLSKDEDEDDEDFWKIVASVEVRLKLDSNGDNLEGVVKTPLRMTFYVAKDELMDPDAVWTYDGSDDDFASIVRNAEEFFEKTTTKKKNSNNNNKKKKNKTAFEVYKTYKQKKSFWFEQHNKKWLDTTTNFWIQCIARVLPESQRVRFLLRGGMEALSLASKEYYWRWTRPVDRGNVMFNEVERRLLKILKRANFSEYAEVLAKVARQFVMIRAGKGMFQASKDTVIDILYDALVYFYDYGNELTLNPGEKIKWDEFKKGFETPSAIVDEIDNQYWTKTLDQHAPFLNRLIKGYDAFILIRKVLYQMINCEGSNLKLFTERPIEVIIVCFCIYWSCIDISELSYLAQNYLSVLWHSATPQIKEYIKDFMKSGVFSISVRLGTAAFDNGLLNPISGITLLKTIISITNKMINYARRRGVQERDLMQPIDDQPRPSRTLQRTGNNGKRRRTKTPRKRR